MPHNERTVDITVKVPIDKVPEFYEYAVPIFGEKNILMNRIRTHKVHKEFCEGCGKRLGQTRYRFCPSCTSSSKLKSVKEIQARKIDQKGRKRKVKY